MLQPLPVPQSPESKFREYLASRPRKQRFTKPQQEMIRLIFSRHQHFDAEHLCSELERARVRISRATVYRTLRKLVEAGLLRQLQFGPRIVYEHDYGYPRHDHLVCQDCGKVIEFQSGELDRVREQVCQTHQFQPTYYSLVIRGTCADCLKERMTKRRLDLV
ncbi:MAG: transcriptional repressor [Gemmataceae bacterium]